MRDLEQSGVCHAHIGKFDASRRFEQAPYYQLVALSRRSYDGMYVNALAHLMPLRATE
jgi:hypothetical protein